MSGEVRILEWADPPPRPPRAQRIDLAHALAALQRRPGKWALVFSSSSGSAVARRKRMLAEAGCEVDAIGGSGGERHLYARWPA